MSQRKFHFDVAIRQLYLSDQKVICDHFRRLDPKSRRARFCGTISDAGLSKYIQCILRYDSILCGAFADGFLRGVVELRGHAQTGSKTTEAAFSVELEWQNIGIGDALFERIILVARKRGIRSIELMCLKENCRMRHLAAKHNAQIRFDQEVAQAILHPGWPTTASTDAEFVNEI